MEYWELEEDLGALGVAGICRETLRALRARCTFFAFLAVFPVLSPLSAFIFLYVLYSLDFLSSVAAGAEAGSAVPVYRLAAYWAALVLFEGICLYVILVIGLTSAAASAFSVAILYCGDGRGGSALDVMNAVVPHVWARRVKATSRDAFLLFLGYSAVFGAACLLATHLLAGAAAPDEQIISGSLLHGLGGAAYLAGAAYIGVVWRVACVVSVLEDARGFAALRRSRALLAGKFWAAAAVHVTLDVCLVAVETAVVVVDALGIGVWIQVVAVMAVLCAVLVVGLVAQVVVYLVCKSHHGESIDMANLAYVGQYVPLGDNNGVELQPQVQNKEQLTAATA